MPSNARTSSPEAPPAADPFLTISQAAEHLSVSRGFIQDSIYKKKTLPAYKIGRNVLRVRRSDVDALITRFHQ